jgi:hypothetical protein
LKIQRKTILIGITALILLAIIAAGAWFFFAPRNLVATTTDSKCVNCHSDKERLKTLTDRFEQVYVDPEQMAQEAHSGLACTTCHGGDPTKDTPEEACINGKSYKDPAAPNIVEKTCGSCHTEITGRFVKSIHASLDGIHTSLVDLMGEKQGTFTFQATCNDCHTSCSSCHMETPDRRNVLYPNTASHHFEPLSDSKNCAACHSGMGDTYFGVEGSPGHAPSLMAQAGIQCTECHGDKDVHGTGTKTTFSMQSPKPQCIDCHSNPTRQTAVANGTEVAPQYSLDIPAHAMHSDTALSCEACHTEWYQSCWNCHNGKTDKTVESLFLAVSPLTQKIQPAAHSPATSGASDPNSSIQGGWAIKSRHSWGASVNCEACHTDAAVYIDTEGRKAPFVGYWSAQHANASFVDDTLVQLLLIDTTKLKQDAHKDTKCDDCHQSLTDNVCASCHDKTTKTGKTVLPADADWSRTDYVAARESLTSVQEWIDKAKSSGMSVTAWESDLKNLHNNYLQISNEFHGNPGQAQGEIKAVSTNSQALAKSIQQTVVAQSSQNQNTPTIVMLMTGLVGAAMLGLVLYRQK